MRQLKLEEIALSFDIHTANRKLITKIKHQLDKLSQSYLVLAKLCLKILVFDIATHRVLLLNV